MTDLAPAAPDTSPSNQLAPTTATPNNPVNFKPDADPEPKVEQAKPLTARQALEKAAADTNVKTEEPKIAAKPAPEVKAAPEPEKLAPARENGRFVSTKEAQQPSGQPEVKGAGQEGEDGNRPSEGRGHETPPARFLPRAKEQWATVPDDVKAEVHRALQNADKGMEEYRESHEFRKELRQFEDMAKKSNTTIPRVLNEYAEIAAQLRQDPAGAVQRLLATVNITPDQYAKHIMGQAQAHQANPALAGQQALERQVQQLTDQIKQMSQMTQQERTNAQQQQAIKDVETTLFAEVRKEHPRFDELREDIAFFFNSAKLSSISDEQSRLYAAVDMAERINPAPHQSSERLSAAPRERPINPAGDKSIKGAPGVNDSVGDKGKLKTRDAIRAAAAELGINM